jgi:hypothetical protein
MRPGVASPGIVSPPLRNPRHFIALHSLQIVTIAVTTQHNILKFLFSRRAGASESEYLTRRQLKQFSDIDRIIAAVTVRLTSGELE